MEILNTYTVLEEASAVICTVCTFIAIISAIFAWGHIYFKNKKAAIVSLIILASSTIITFKCYNNNRKTRMEILLTDMSYAELVEQYDVVKTRGRIITVQDK